MKTKEQREVYVLFKESDIVTVIMLPRLKSGKSREASDLQISLLDDPINRICRTGRAELRLIDGVTGDVRYLLRINK